MNAKAQNDTTIANVAGRDKRITAIRDWGNADATLGAALVACFVVVAETGATDAAEVAEGRNWYSRNPDGEKVPTGSCSAYASTFNRAAKVASKLGIGPTVKLIKDAAQGAAGRAKESVYDALGAALAYTKAEGITDATAAQSRKVAKVALASAADKGTEKKAKGKAAPRASAKQQAGTVTVAATQVAASRSWQEGAHALRLITNTLSGAATPEGMDAQCRELLAKLGDACEAAQPFMAKRQLVKGGK